MSNSNRVARSAEVPDISPDEDCGLSRLPTFRVHVSASPRVLHASARTVLRGSDDRDSSARSKQARLAV